MLPGVLQDRSDGLGLLEAERCVDSQPKKIMTSSIEISGSIKELQELLIGEGIPVGLMVLLEKGRRPVLVHGRASDLGWMLSLLGSEKIGR